MEAIKINDLQKNGLDGSSMLGGFIAANVLVKITKQDNLIGNGIMALGGVVGASMIDKDSPLRLLVLGASLFGALRVGTIAFNTANSLTGIPESIKEKIKLYLPQINGIGDAKDEFIDINLDDQVETIDAEHEIMGIGQTEILLT